MTSQKTRTKKTKKKPIANIRASNNSDKKSHKGRQKLAKLPSVGQERFELALESLSVGIWDWNLIDGLLYWSPKYRQMLGFADGAFQPTPADFESRLHPDDRLIVTTALQAHIRDQIPFDVECRLRHNTGQHLWVRLCGVAQRNRAGRAHRMVGSVDDISVRKEAEQKLSEREARLRNMFEHAADGLITINTRGIVQSYNPACEKLFGYRADEVVGRNVSMLMPEPYHSEHDGYLTNYMLTGEAKIIGIGREVEGRRKDGTLFPMDLSISEFRSGGEILFSGVVRDITQRKQIERMKSEFISVVSHELRTPLTSIRGSLGLLANSRDAGLPAPTLELLEIARRNSERLVVLINDILDMEKLESGKMRVLLQPVALDELLTDAVTANAAYATRFGVTLNLWTEPDLPPGLADPDRLTQVVANLLSNAAKFTRQGSDVDIQAVKTGDRIQISVRDHGDGIPEEMRGRVFEKFSQADHSNSRERTGTGLGLSIARHLMRLMNGDVTFSSEPGKGATFFIRLPIAREVGTGLPAQGWDRDRHDDLPQLSTSGSTS
jgi:PAS domain S-box-containing protein